MILFWCYVFFADEITFAFLLLFVYTLPALPAVWPCIFRLYHWGGRLDRWFALFVRTGYEHDAVRVLKNMLPHKDYLPFVLTKETMFRGGGTESRLERKILFPGYVIIKTPFKSDKVLKDVKPIVNTAGSYFYRILHRGKEIDNIMIKESEQAFWESIADSDFCVKASEGVLDEDNNLRIVKGPLTGKEDFIKKVSRYKEKAFLDAAFGGEIFEVSMVLKLRRVNKNCGQHAENMTKDNIK